MSVPVGETGAAEVQGDSSPQPVSNAGTPSALVIVGPSGVGKNTLIERLRKDSDLFGHSVSHTTRKPREGEQVCGCVFVFFWWRVWCAFLRTKSGSLPTCTSCPFRIYPHTHLHPQHGVHYYYTTKEQFTKEIGEGRFIEHAEVHGNLYGTSFAAVRSVLDTGRSCILDIDVQGARLVRKTALKVGNRR